MKNIFRDLLLSLSLFVVLGGSLQAAIPDDPLDHPKPPASLTEGTGDGLVGRARVEAAIAAMAEQASGEQREREAERSTLEQRQLLLTLISDGVFPDSQSWPTRCGTFASSLHHTSRLVRSAGGLEAWLGWQAAYTALCDPAGRDSHRDDWMGDVRAMVHALHEDPETAPFWAPFFATVHETDAADALLPIRPTEIWICIQRVADAQKKKDKTRANALRFASEKCGVDPDETFGSTEPANPVEPAAKTSL